MSERICSLPDCQRRMKSRGLCGAHYQKLRKYGDPLAGVRRPRRPTFEPEPCRIIDCPRFTDLRSYDQLCSLHIGRLRRQGDPEMLLRFCPNRAQSPVDVLHMRSEPHGDCVHWTGGLTDQGYGVATRSILGGASKPHRASYEMAFGPIPDGLQLDHLCHTNDPTCMDGDACLHRRCINPDHLEPVTWRENLRRARFEWGSFA